MSGKQQGLYLVKNLEALPYSVLSIYGMDTGTFTMLCQYSSLFNTLGADQCKV